MAKHKDKTEIRPEGDCFENSKKIDLRDMLIDD